MIVRGAIEADDETLWNHLEMADPLILRAVIFEFTGDRTFDDARITMALGHGGYGTVAVMDPDDAERVRRRAFALIRSWRDAGQTPAVEGSPTPDHFAEMLNLAAGIRLDEALVAPAMEEATFVDMPRDLAWREQPDPARLAQFHVLVIGTGFGGLAAGVLLKRLGIPFTIVERNAGVGGTWYSNAYPDCRVDVPSHAYCYSFEANYPWKHFFAPQGELQAYFEHCAEKYGLNDHIVFDTLVEGGSWDEASGRWTMRLGGRDGLRRELVVDAVISAAGLFNRPRMPDIPGLSAFEGEVLHTATWPAGALPEGRRVALLGTGASGMQTAPALAQAADQLYIFQRSPSWVAAVPGYRDPIPEGVTWLFERVPLYLNYFRAKLFLTFAHGVHELYDRDPDWKGEVSINARTEAARQALVAYMHAKIGDDPALVAKCTPTYTPFARRMVLDNGWYDALRRPNVTLVTDPIDCITPDGVRTTTGETYEVDLLACASGFHANDYLWPMDLQGRGGLTLAEAWKADGPRAYAGITIPGFPNLFCLYGPNTNPRAGAPCMWAEYQARYAATLIVDMILEGVKSYEIRQDIHDEYNAALDRRLANSTWMDERGASYYRNQFNRVGVNMPWGADEYYGFVAQPNVEEFIVERHGEAPPSGDTSPA